MLVFLNPMNLNTLVHETMDFFPVIVQVFGDNGSAKQAPAGCFRFVSAISGNFLPVLWGYPSTPAMKIYENGVNRRGPKHFHGS